jgi:hypothetical protein
MADPKYLTGDKSGLKEFIDKFDVNIETLLPHRVNLLTLSKTFLFDCDGMFPAQIENTG